MVSGQPSDEKGGSSQTRFLAHLKCTDPKTMDQAMSHGMGQGGFCVLH